MAIGFEKALGIHQQALMLRTQRAQVLANNLVNAETPNFKARDVNFQAMLQQANDSRSAASMKRTRVGHLDGTASPESMELMYRMPSQPSINGNTVEESEEMARFSKNAIDFQASFQFLNGRFKGLKNAIRGEV